MKSRAKFQYVRSKKLMEAYRWLQCQHCGIDDGTVCGAHSNQAKHGKARGIKASDIYCASLCHRCHMMIDQGAHMTREEREAAWDTVHAKTVIAMVRMGVWPDGVPVPKVEEFFQRKRFSAVERAWQSGYVINQK